MLGAVDRVHKYVGDSSYEDFLRDDLLRDAIARQVLIVAEAADKTFELERKQGIEGDRRLDRRCPDIPWRSIRDMGILLRHIYGREGPEEIWEMIRDGDLRDLRAALVSGYAELDLG